MILVTGDVVLDHNIYVGRRPAPDTEAVPGTQYLTEPGGAMLTYGLLEALSAAARGTAIDADTAGSRDLAFGLQDVDASTLAGWPPAFHVGGIWEPFPGPTKGTFHWRLTKSLGYGARGHVTFPGSPTRGQDLLQPRVLVIDDGGLGFRLKTASKCWPEWLTTPDAARAPKWTILKMSRPLGTGDLFRKLSEHQGDRLIVIISADDLRREEVRVRRGLSWESTVDDLVDAVHSNPAIRGLRSCRHLLITLRGDAALWLEAPGREIPGPCRLVFDREKGEGEWEESHKQGAGFGYLSAVAAAVAWHLHEQAEEQPDLTGALGAGLSTARFLREHGHGPMDNSTPGFPFHEAATHMLKPRYRYASSDVPGPTDACGSPDPSASCANWTLLRRTVHADAFPGPLFGPARRLALLGPASLENVPCARFGMLLTMDRGEIETLRSLRQLMLNYRDGGPQKQPLSVAVFGAPGSGKSFGLKQIAAGVFGDKNPVLEFNLSQLGGPGDLLGAYHQVRDQVLAGTTPVVFWDEFDSGNYKWLQFLLAPMQDGKFQEGQLSHSIGKCIFVFAGGTSRDYAHFGPPDVGSAEATDEERRARRDFAMAKGPDFKSRLAGFFDVLGPNPRQVFDEEAARAGLDPWVDDPTDTEFPVRRAILLRSMLGMIKEKENDPLTIDRGLLTALLELRHWRYGARSLEKLVNQIRQAGGPRLGRAHLPPDDLLALHVDDVRQFHSLIRRTYTFQAQAEELAPIIHEDWRSNLPEVQRGGIYDLSYGELDHEGRAANIAAALRMPEILALAGFVLEPGDASEQEHQIVDDFLMANLEFLAEAEHQGWEQQRRTEGWTHGPERDNDRRVHPLLRPYAELPEEEKNKDRGTIRNYTKYARSAGFRIVSRRRPSS